MSPQMQDNTVKFEMFFIHELRPPLNGQSDSIYAKVFKMISTQHLSNNGKNQGSYDHCSYERNLSNCVRSLKKSGLQQGLNL